jgi:NAD+ kinase
LQINLLVNTHRIDAIEAAKNTATFLKERRVLVGSERESASLIGAEPISSDKIGKADLVITFGGDGTLIRGAHLCSAHGTPILGVFFGRFGFVTQVDPNELGAVLSIFFDGAAKVQERLMLQTELFRHGKLVATLHSLNEAVLQRAATTRMLHFEVTIDGHHLNSYPADGVLVSTPTGSTGYNLSAGGPIVDPGADCLVLTAITPHTLSYRPLVLGSNSVIELKIDTRGDAILSCDGQSRLEMLSGDSVRVTKSSRVTRLITVDDQDFLHKLTDRLFWTRRDPPVGD